VAVPHHHERKKQEAVKRTSFLIKRLPENPQIKRGNVGNTLRPGGNSDIVSRGGGGVLRRLDPLLHHGGMKKKKDYENTSKDS